MKHLPAALKIAFKALRTNKMRSALTMLGMVVGVGAVIAMVAVGQEPPNASRARSNPWAAI